MGFCDASIIGMGRMWLDPTKTGKIMMWHHDWTPNITYASVLDTNPWGTLTNSYLDLTTLVLREVNLLEDFPEASMESPPSGLDNTPTVSWSTWEVSTTNPVV